MTKTIVISFTGALIVSLLLLNNTYPSLSSPHHLTPSVLAQTGSTDWPQLQHDAQHTGRTNVSVAPDYQVAWAWMDKTHIVKNFISQPGSSLTDNFEPDFRVSVLFANQMQPVVANDTVYVGSLNGTLYAIDAATGNNRWDFSTGGPILATSIATTNIVITASLDGIIYGLDPLTGTKIWEYNTNAGISASPVLSGTNIYLGSRNGQFFALDSQTGTLKWHYVTRIPDPSRSRFAPAPILAPPAISTDGSTVVFGAENMYLYALNTVDGTEKWPPRPVSGNSFQYSWPVIANNYVFLRTITPIPGAEYDSGDPNIEAVLDSLPADPTWTQERTAIQTFLDQSPLNKTMTVIDLNTGTEPYQVAMGRVTGNNFSAHPPVIDDQDRLLTYWRSKTTTVFQGGTFGSNYCPDLSQLDPQTGDRLKITLPISLSGRMQCPELDNGFALTVGGNYVYMHNHFRGLKVYDLVTGINRGITGTLARRDCAGWRGGTINGGWGYQIIYYGNDNYIFPTDCSGTPLPGTPDYPIPPTVTNNSVGFAGATIASINSTPMLFVNEGDAYAIVALKHKL